MGRAGVRKAKNLKSSHRLVRDRGGLKWLSAKWLAQKLGTTKWVVAARWSPKLREKYDTRLSQALYNELRAEWELTNLK